MVRYENNCCNCASPGYPCIGSLCSLRSVKTFYCDECNEEIDPDEIYLVENEHLCEECLKKKFRMEYDG